MSYSIIKELGSGGMGKVYLAKDEEGNLVALKMMSNRYTCYAEYRELFQSEVNALWKMNHPSVVRIVGQPYSDPEGNLYLPMEYIDGTNVSTIIRQNGPYSETEARRLMCDLLSAVSYVHARGCIHRDIKPSNVMIRRDGSVCLIDFGVAKDAYISTGHTVGRVVGSDGYMSPEQATGLNIDYRTDIYSLGCVLFFMVTGQQAIRNTNSNSTRMEILSNNIPDIRTINSTLSDNLNRIIHKATDRNMRYRYQNADEFRNDLLRSDSPRISVRIGSDSDNDIVVRKNGIEGHHATIEYTESNGYYTLIYNDLSSTGTRIGNAHVSNSAVSLPFQKVSRLPRAFLAGLPDCELNWQRVIKVIQKRGGMESIDTSDKEDSKDEISGMMALLCIIVPFVGLVFWGTKEGDKAKQAGLYAAIGGGIWIVGIIVVILSQL